MATGKRYYWMKLKESFMTSDTIDYFMSQPNGANYVVLYQLLCLKTINTGGRLSRQIGEIIIPYDVEKIQRDCKWFSTDTVRVALNLYKAAGLIYEDVDGTLVLTNHNELVGSETDYALQKKRQRDNSQQLPPHKEVKSVDNVHENVHTDIDIDIRDRDKSLDIDIEKDKEDKEKEIYKEKEVAESTEHYDPRITSIDWDEVERVRKERAEEKARKERAWGNGYSGYSKPRNGDSKQRNR